MNNKTNVNRKYKDSVFTKLFRRREKLAELYNALAGTNYAADDINLVTLENIIFIGRENDISFTVDGKLIVLIEHQSSINPNMPLRCLLYIAREYQRLADNEAMYSSRLVKIMPPEFIVVYNGTDEYPEKSTLNLSDAFIEKIDHLELKVKVYNVNHGQNSHIMNRSNTLNEYSIFVSRARTNINNGLEAAKALEKAVKDCIKDNILSAFLKIHGSDVINMLSMEFNLDDALRVREKDGREKAKEEIAINLLGVLDIKTIAEKTKLSIKRVNELKSEYEQIP
jgi:hypothetical protein